MHCPTSVLPSCAQLSWLRLIHLCDALLYSKEKMLMLYLFIRFSKKGQSSSLSLYLPQPLLACAVQQGSATWSRPLSVVCSLSVPHGSSKKFFNRKKGFKSNLKRALKVIYVHFFFIPTMAFICSFLVLSFFHALLGVHHFIAQHSLLRRAGDTWAIWIRMFLF